MPAPISRILSCLLVTTVCAGAGYAQTPARVEILPGVRGADGVQHAGLRIVLAPGWKTYWRSPGDAGIAPEFDLSASANLKAFTPEFPAPVLFSTSGMVTPGYKDEVVLPLDLVPADPSKPIELKGTVSLGVCHDVCLPVTLRLSADLEGQGLADPRIDAARAARPDPLNMRPTCVFEPISDGMRMTATLPAGFADGDVPLVEFSDPNIWISQPDLSLENGQVQVVTDLVPPSGAPFAIDRSALRFTVVGDGRAVEMSGCVPG